MACPVALQLVSVRSSIGSPVASLELVAVESPPTVDFCRLAVWPVLRRAVRAWSLQLSDVA
eukprot:10675173-Lingulodinium_polyedra.AAC.1